MKQEADLENILLSYDCFAKFQIMDKKPTGTIIVASA